MKRLLNVLEPLCLILVPTVLVLCAIFGWKLAALTGWLAVGVSLVPFFVRLEYERARPRDLMPIVVLAAIATVGRAIFVLLPNFKPVSAIVIVAGVCLGRQSGFLTGALAALASNFIFGQGAFTPWQMFAWGAMGYLAGVLAKKDQLKNLPLVLCYGFFASFGYGILMDSWHIVGFVSPLTWPVALAAYGSGFVFNLVHMVSTVVFLYAIYPTWSRKISRIRRKFDLMEP